MAKMFHIKTDDGKVSPYIRCRVGLTSQYFRREHEHLWELYGKRHTIRPNSVYLSSFYFQDPFLGLGGDRRHLCAGFLRIEQR